VGKPVGWEPASIRTALRARAKKWLDAHLAAHPDSRIRKVNHILDEALREFLDRHEGTTEIDVPKDKRPGTDLDTLERLIDERVAKALDAYERSRRKSKGEG